MTKINDNSTPQELFDHVVTHLFTQKVQSRDGDGPQCLYRGPSGTSCAVGCVLPDEYYDEAMDGKSDSTDLYSVIENFKLPEYIVKNQDLLVALQKFHDKYVAFDASDEEQLLRLEGIAWAYDLTFYRSKYV